MSEFTKRMVIFVVSLACFMEGLDTTVLNTAIPTIAHSLAINPINLKIALISYLLSLAVFIPISGWIADKFGIERIFMSAVIIFILGSIGCGFSSHLWVLVFYRIIQGLGGALMLPVGRLIVIRSFPRNEIIKRLCQVVLFSSLGMMFGPFLGGLIVSYVSWHWIFWINIPIGLINIWMIRAYLADTPPQEVPPLDKGGFILFSFGLAALTFGLSAFSDAGIPDFMTATILVAAIVLLGAYFFHSKNRQHPVVKLILFKIRTFKISVLGNIIARLGFGGMPFLLPLFLQLSLHYSAKISGFILMALALGGLLINPVMQHLPRFLGFRRFLIINTFLVGISIWTFAFVDAKTPVLTISLLVLIFGVLVSLQYTGMNSLAYSDIDTHHLSSATSMMGTVQQLSISFGVAAAAALIRCFSPITAENIVLPVHTFHIVFSIIGAITLCSLSIFISLKSDDGIKMIT